MKVGKLYKMKRQLMLWSRNGTCAVNPGDIVMCVVKRKEVGLFRGQSVFQHKILVRDSVYNLPSLTEAEQDRYLEPVGKQ